MGLINLFTLCLITLSAKVSNAGVTSRCPDYFVQRDNSCYRPVKKDLTWFQASHFCTLYLPEHYSCHLVTVESPAEQAWLAEFLRRDSDLGNRDFWTGYNKLDSMRPWIWSSKNNNGTWANWAPGEPSNDGKCMLLYSQRNFQWADNSCRSPYSFICEVELTAL